MDLYAEHILEHYRTPRRKELLPSPSVEHEEVNLSCGDSVKIHLGITDDRVNEVGWTGSGCAISQAAMSILGEELVGKSLEEIDAIDSKTIRKLLGVPISTRRAKCAFLGLHALKNALHAHRNEEPQGWSETMKE